MVDSAFADFVCSENFLEEEDELEEEACYTSLVTVAIAVVCFVIIAVFTF